MEVDSAENYDSNENYNYKTTRNYTSSTLSLIERHLTTTTQPPPISQTAKVETLSIEKSNLKSTTTASFLIFNIDEKSSTASIQIGVIQNSTESYLGDTKIGKSRHRKRIGKLYFFHLASNFLAIYQKMLTFVKIEVANTTTIASTTITSTTLSTTTQTLSTKRIFNANIGCNLKYISTKPTYVVFMGVFHCAWMSNIASTSSAANSSAVTSYYITKGYKGSSLTMCLDLDELKSYRCYRHMPLHYSYYGTGQAIYKGYLFYNQDGTNNIIVHNIESEQVTKVRAPEEAACCNMDDNLYNVKHSGFFDFETDENGLWLIYKQARPVMYESDDYPVDYSPSEIASDKHNSGNDNTNEGKSQFGSFDQEVYVVAKIDESNLAEMRIERKWTVRTSRENVANMFIICGQLYALKNTAINPAQMYKLCDLINDATCSNNYDSENSDLFNLTISSRQITSLKYDPDRKLLYMVDGGSFVYYKTQI
jgi:hypothetical protein